MACVLIADDDIVVRDVVRRYYLERDGLDVAVADDGDEALRLLDTKRALSRCWVSVTWKDRWGEHRNGVVQGPPLPGGDHQSLRVAVFRFPLSFREVEELMLARGVVLSYETIRRWCAKFGQAYASQLRRRRPRPGDKWHLDEVFVKINGITHYLWRAVDQHRTVLTC